MAVITTTISCELQEAVKVQYLNGNIFSQDNQANVINVNVFNNGIPVTLTGTISANITRQDGGTVAATGGTISGNVASITLPAAAYAVPGVVSIVIKNTNSSVVTTIAAIVANVYQSSTDTVVDPGTIIPSIQTLISSIETAVASIPADYSSLWTTLAPAFSSSATYAAGQYVTNNGGLYRFTTSHSGAWSSSDAVSVNIGGELSNLKSAIVLNNESIIGTKTTYDVDPLIIPGSKVASSTGVISSDASYKRSDYTQTFGGSAIAFSSYIVNVCFYDENKTFISGTASIQESNPIPNNAYYFIFTLRNVDSVPDITISNAEPVIKKVNNHIDDLQKNILFISGNISMDIGNFIIGEYAKSTDGSITSSSSYKRTDYIYMYNGRNRVLNVDGIIVSVCFYDENKTFVGSVASSTIALAPDNAVYFIISASANKTVTGATLQNVSNLKSLVYSDLLQVERKNINGTQYPNNLVNVFDWIDNYYVDYQNGTLISNNGYYCTGFIPVVAGTTYKANRGRNFAWYKSDKTYLSGVQGTTIQSGVTAPTNAAYIRFSVNKTTDASSDPFNLYFTDSSSFSIDVVIPNLVVSPRPWCYGKTINWIGDSIVDTSDFDDYVCSALNLTQLTVDGSTGGINGSTIALNGDGTDTRHALCERYDDMPANADLIAVSCGTNDWMYAWSPIGTINDPDDGTSNTTFYGALKALCKGLIDRYPKKVIFFTTPIKRGQAFAGGAGGEYTPDGVMTTPFSKNKYGKTLMDYADIIKEVCGYYSIPVLDMYRESVLNPHIASQQDMFDSVLTHPNATGSKIMARRVAGWITQLGYNIP